MDNQPVLPGDRRELTAEEFQRLVTAAHVARSRAITAFCIAMVKGATGGAIRFARRSFQDRKERAAQRLLAQ